MTKQSAQGAALVALVGAESTGKTTLARALSQALSASSSGLRVAWVPEVLRQWCDHKGRTPLQHEQAAIAIEQHARIEAAAAQHDLVVCDTTGLMTAVYSGLVFGDHGLDHCAARWHQQVNLTLLTALDLPWVADGHQRDGPQVQAPVDQALRSLLLTNNLPFSVVGGQGQKRLQRAVTAVHAMLTTRPDSRPPGQPENAGLLTRLITNDPRAGPAASRSAWACECCIEAPYERALRQQHPSGA